MNDWRQEIEESLRAFILVSELACEPIKLDEIVTEYLPAPHKPTSLPRGKMAVYGFWCNGVWLKIGKVGPNSGARYVSQHYTGSAMSTLVGSLSNATNTQVINGFNENNPGNWIRQNTCRVNLLISAEKPKVLLSMLETFLHTRLKPQFEG